jgi:hypothetical protein
MKAVRKGLENIHTMRSMVNRSMPTTSGGALMERARLDRERERLRNETDRLERRLAVIRNRLSEIGKLEQWLERFVETAQSPPWNKGDGSTGNSKGKRGSREMILKY